MLTNLSLVKLYTDLGQFLPIWTGFSLQQQPDARKIITAAYLILEGVFFKWTEIEHNEAQRLKQKLNKAMD